MLQSAYEQAMFGDIPITTTITTWDDTTVAFGEDCDYCNCKFAPVTETTTEAEVFFAMPEGDPIDYDEMTTYTDFGEPETEMVPETTESYFW